jgi:FeS assembly SUF system protein
MKEAAMNQDPAAPGPAPEPVDAAAAEPRTLEEIEADIIDTLRTCYDPEIPVNIYDLGLIYDIKLDEAQFAHVQMTLTSPMCPVAGTLPPEVQHKIAQVPGVSGAAVDLVWDPPWNQDMMGEAAKLKLGLDL